MEQITHTIQNKIETTIYGYQPTEFMPIRVDGQVANWDAFIAYKAKRVAGHVGRAAWNGIATTIGIASAAIDAIQQAS